MPAAPDYRKILTDLYQRHNPEKVKDVDFLLKKFAGREEEMVAKIKEKYGVEEEEVVVTPPPAPEELARRKRRRKRLRSWIAVVLLFGGAAAGAWTVVSTGYFDGLFASEPTEKLYVIADTVHTHSVCDLGKDSRLLQLPFGKEVLVSERESTCIVTEIDGDRHYIPQKYLGTDLEFTEINAIYGNDAARALYDNSYEKRALRNYFSRKGFKGDIPEEKQLELYGRPHESEVWQVVALEGEPPVNVVAKGKFATDGEVGENEEGGKRPPDFAAIVSKKDDPEQRRLAVFRFNAEKVDEFVGDLDLSDYPGYFMRSVTYGMQEVLWDNYLVLDPEWNNDRKGYAILLEKETQTGVKYLVETRPEGLVMKKLRKTLLGYKIESTIF